MTTVYDVEQRLFAFAPKDLAQSWDNVGLLVGDGRQEVRRILVALDITQNTVEEALSLGCELIVAHHPVMNCAWHPVQTLRRDDPQGKLLMTLIENHVSAICMHTNLDSCEGGVNDALAKALSLSEISPLSPDGLGRVGYLPYEMEPGTFASYVTERLQAGAVRFASGGHPIRKIAVGGGACGEFAPLAKSLGCDAFVTADLKYHDFQNAAPLAMTLVDAGHFPTENVVCPVVAELLRESFPDVYTALSSRHADVIETI